MSDAGSVVEINKSAATANKERRFTNRRLSLVRRFVNRRSLKTPGYFPASTARYIYEMRFSAVGS